MRARLAADEGRRRAVYALFHVLSELHDELAPRRLPRHGDKKLKHGAFRESGKRNLNRVHDSEPVKFTALPPMNEVLSERF